MLGVLELLFYIRPKVLLEILWTTRMVWHVLFDVIYLALKYDYLVAFLILLVESLDLGIASEG